MCAIIDANVTSEVFTNDRNLEKDFKNRLLIPGERGKIYRKPEHRRLLHQRDLCPGNRPATP